MSALEAVLIALSGFSYPKVPRRYEGNEKKYFTYNYASDHGADFGDDEPGCNEVTIQVHFFMPLKENFQKEKNRIRYQLFLAGFTWPEVVVLEENDTMTRHIVFECSYVETVYKEEE